MANRVIKDSIWHSPSLARMPGNPSKIAKYAYYQDQWPRWLLLADDWGCFNADLEVIKGLAYPKRRETVSDIGKTMEIFENNGDLFIWEAEGRKWGFFVSFGDHNFCNASSVDDDGKYTKHRRKTPEPPADLLKAYSDKFRQVPTKSLIPNPNPNPKHIQSVQVFISNQEPQKLFGQLWEKYPNKDSRSKSEALFVKTVLNETDRTDIQKALDNYQSLLKAETWRKPQSGKTWFGNWKDWVNFVPPKVSEESNTKPILRAIHANSECLACGRVGMVWVMPNKRVEDTKCEECKERKLIPVREK